MYDDMYRRLHLLSSIYIYDIRLISYECSALVAARASSCHRTIHDMIFDDYDYCHYYPSCCHADMIIR